MYVLDGGCFLDFFGRGRRGRFSSFGNSDETADLFLSFVYHDIFLLQEPFQQIDEEDLAKALVQILGGCPFPLDFCIAAHPRSEQCAPIL